MVKRKEVKVVLPIQRERRDCDEVPHGMTRSSALERHLLNGHHYQQCGGGRRIIKKKLVNVNY